MEVSVIENPQIDVSPVALNLREADYREIYAASGRCPAAAVMQSWDTSRRKWVIKLGTKPIGVFGVGSPMLLSDIGIPWLVGTKDLETIKKTFVKSCRRYISQMLERYDRLVNFVDVRNTLSIKWLKWCGFQFHHPAPYGCKGLIFQKFYMEKQ